jgi:hypothetical protein
MNNHLYFSFCFYILDHSFVSLCIFISYSFMAVCIVEDAVLTSIHYQAIHIMKRTPSCPFVTTNDDEYHQQYSFNCHGNPISTFSSNQELTKKRQLNRSNTYSNNTESIITVIDNSCSSPAGSTNNNEGM